MQRRRIFALCVEPLPDGNFDVASGDRLADCCDHTWQLSLDARPARREEHNDRDAATGQILLVLEAAVRGDEDFKPRRLGFGDQQTVLKRRPSALERRFDGIPDKGFAQWCRRALIKQDLQFKRLSRNSEPRAPTPRGLARWRRRETTRRTDAQTRRLRGSGRVPPPGRACHERPRRRSRGPGLARRPGRWTNQSWRRS